jgi:hypothetical protein
MNIRELYDGCRVPHPRDYSHPLNHEGLEIIQRGEVHGPYEVMIAASDHVRFVLTVREGRLFRWQRTK